jgi:hypothetical protein
LFDLADLFLGELRAPTLSAANIARSRTATLHHLGHIGLMGSFAQVGRVNATGIVAGMDAFRLRPATNSEKVAVAMSENHFTGKAKLAVAVHSEGFSPQPTGVGFMNFSPKAFRRW